MRIAVFGAGGRAGRRVTAEAVRRGHEVVAVVRDVVAHGGLASDVAALRAAELDAAGAVIAGGGHVTVDGRGEVARDGCVSDVAGDRGGSALARGARPSGVAAAAGGGAGAWSGSVSVHRGDVTDPASVLRLVDGCDAVVSAVTPASGPEVLARTRLDERYFVKAADALLAAGAPRIVVVGLFATLYDDSGNLVMDDPSAFPPQLRAFAQAHLAGLERLRQETGQRWLVLTPTARLEPDGERTGRYRLGGEQLPHDESDGLSYADLAVAVLDEIERPTRYGRVVVYR
ncbi:NAD(P)H-binding protein [Dactylosporangium sp. NPDC005572]|uniref:NAD(P)-dependent oxidoreductase n=1 Tax=Dactylosporangium sp. NPDC005572 TaxID=3156889 RepID=UPI0033AC1C7D